VIEDPQTVGEGINAYTTYAIKTKKMDGTPLMSIRRYSDFFWIQEELFYHFKYSLIPPLPEKGVLSRLNPEFIEYRRKELERFLKRVLSDPMLKEYPSVAIFLEGSDFDIMEAKQKFEKREKSVFGFIPNIFNTNKTVEEIDDWFKEYKKYIVDFETNLQLLDSKESNLLQLKSELSLQLTGLCSTSNEVAIAEEKYNEVKVNIQFRHVSELYHQLSIETIQAIKKESDNFHDILKDSIRMLDCVKKLLTNRDDVLNVYDTKLKDYESKMQKFQTQRDNPKVALLYQNAENEYQESKSEYESCNLKVQNELVKFQSTKGNELKVSIKNLAKVNMDYHVICSTYWKDMFLRLDKELSDLEENK